jgi:hypothetical protein
MNIRICRHCKQSFDIVDKPSGWMANHSRWCNENPKRKDYVEILKKNNNIVLMSIARKQNGKTNQYTKARIEGTTIPENNRKGKTGFKGTPHTEEMKQYLREKALASPHRRLRKGIIEYKGMLLDSSWELALAKRLDEQNIEWIRPQPLKWVDNDGVAHNYFPDFYLPKYNVYLDPKNPQAIKVQNQKLQILLKQYSNIVILSSLEECNNYVPT